MPEGTVIKVNGVVIGLSGRTGRATGNHLHIQKVSRGRVVNPAGEGFVLPKPATVTETGENSGNGKYVRIKDRTGTEWTYMHLSKINVSKGALKKEEPMYKNKTAEQWGKRYEDMRDYCIKLEQEQKKLMEKISNRNKIIETMQKQMQEIITKPPQVIVKEIEKPALPAPTNAPVEPLPKPGFWESIAKIFSKK